MANLIKSTNNASTNIIHNQNLLLFTVVLFIGQLTAVAQTDDQVSIYNKAGSTHLGLGVGLTYGGIGGRFVFSSKETLAIMLGAGYNVVGIGYNLGMMCYVPTDSKTQAYFSGMWGTNSAIKITGLPSADESYHGVSFGFGAIFNSNTRPGNYWDLGIIIPVRSAEFKEDWDAIKNWPGIEIQQDPFPILINIGYNFKI